MTVKKERASWPMKDWEVRVIRDGSKTQHRIPVKLPHQNPLGVWEPFLWGGMDGGKTRDGLTMPEEMTISHTRTGEIIGCPHGQPGDRLWVREATHRRPMLNFLTGEPLDSKYDGGAYTAGGEDVLTPDDLDLVWWHSRKSCPATQMPRHVSRITLEIVSVRAERLQDISNDDAEAEGCNGLHDFDCFEGSPASSSAHADQGCQCGNYFASEVYARLWKSINGPGSWDANPWVWVLEFKVV